MNAMLSDEDGGLHSQPMLDIPVYCTTTTIYYLSDTTILQHIYYNNTFTMVNIAYTRHVNDPFRHNTGGYFIDVDF